MSFVIAAPEVLVAAASDLAGIGTTLSAANGAAAASTTRLLAAGADEVSAATASLFSSHAQDFHALGIQAAAFHDQFAQALNGGAGLICQRRGRQRPADSAERRERTHPGTVGASADRQRRQRGPGDRG
jgi:PE family